MNNQDLRVIKTRENIMYQFIQCLKKYSFEEITVSMIVEQSRINRSTFYRNYKDKYDLLDQLQSYLTEELRKNLDCGFVYLHQKSSLEFQQFIKKQLEYLEERKEYLNVLWNAKLTNDFFSLMVDTATENTFSSMLNSYYITDENKALAYLYSNLLSSTLLYTARWWLQQAPNLTSDEIAKIQVRNVENGIFTSVANTFKTKNF